MACARPCDDSPGTLRAATSTDGPSDWFLPTHLGVCREPVETSSSRAFIWIYPSTDHRPTASLADFRVGVAVARVGIGRSPSQQNRESGQRRQ